MVHQQMGYDRAITMFSPDGRLLQVEYAKKTVKQGSTSIGMVCKDGVLLVTDKRIVDTLIVPESIEKIWPIDDHMITTAVGIISDARVLVERAQLTSQQHQVTYSTPIDVPSIVKDICSLKQMCTQSAGLRPFGVSLLITCIDKEGSSLYMTDPTGIFFKYKAVAVGEGETEVLDILHKKYKEDMTLDEGIKLAVESLIKYLDKEFVPERLDIAYITTAKKKNVRMKKEEIAKICSEIKKK
jgi:proteasome alpha subunit